MSLLSDHTWKLKYTPDDGDLVKGFYVPALECAVRYDRLTGYFQARALTLAVRGIEGLVRNNGRMRLLVGCTLDQPEIDAIAKGVELQDQLQVHLLANPLKPGNQREVQALELLAWMVANQVIEVQVAVPCNHARQPVPGLGIFHEKAGIIEDKTGDRLAFNGSLNETEAGWSRNWESLNIFRSWLGDDPRVAAEEANFAKLWAGESAHVLTMPVPDAVRDDLLRFLPEKDLPARLKKAEPEPEEPEVPEPKPAPEPEPLFDLRQAVWSYISQAPKAPHGGERVGEATANVEPWPHQVRAFDRLYGNWPPRLLIADEVGLGKTIQAGMLIRQAWLAGKARRVLILAPASVCPQWQIELREKFNLNWPVYDGDEFHWLPVPGRQGQLVEPVSRSDWHKQPFVIASSHLMRRRDRAAELLDQAEPWDILVLDEAHHARRKSPALATDRRPNRLLDLLQRLKDRVQALLLLTATPMQVHPVEVWDLLSLLGLPTEWHEQAFLRFFAKVESPAPSHDDMEFLAAMFRTTEQHYGASDVAAVKRAGATSGLQAKRVLSALRDEAAIPRRQMTPQMRTVALRLIRSHSPVGRLISRHTRDLLRRYHKAGKLETPIAERAVEDRFVEMSAAESRIYAAVEDYISSTYNQASAKRRNAVGFVMTVYRRRLASSFLALRCTLEDRLEAMTNSNLTGSRQTEEEVEDINLDTEGDVLSPDEIAEFEQASLAEEEKSEIARLLDDIRQLPPDSKADQLRVELEALRSAGYPQVMVFTQYTDTMDFLRDQLAINTELKVMCFSGRGGETRGPDGTWQRISREKVKALFRSGQADVLVCTDAAAEGLNFQFCGALINFDMPWNPMRVEQRIGRIDRLGQQHAKIRIINLHYQGTVETDVYMALRRRINLFESVVGRLQPILAKLPGVISGHVLNPHSRDPDARSALTGDLEQEAEKARNEGFNLDEMVEADLEEPPRPAPTLTLEDLDLVLQRPDALPPEVAVKALQAGEYAYQLPGMPEPVRVTTRRDYFDAHSESVELWSPGSPVFPEVPTGETPQTVAESIDEILRRAP
ncbi:MAG: DEAD/DEAH box helicase family protein [Verrucomicrobiales bacterium]|nr:DEAD/DEAH box helicase family protein [Verrucomicrobiales bacterium]